MILVRTSLGSGLALAAALLGTMLPTAALADSTYDLVVVNQLNDGERAEMPFRFRLSYFDCLDAKKEVQIGHKFGPGLLVSANGKSPGGTIIDARCVQRTPKMGE